MDIVAVLWVGRLVGLSRTGLSLFHVVSAGPTPLFVVSRQVGGRLAGPDGFTHTSGSCLGLSAGVP